MTDIRHVIANPGGGWDVRSPSEARASSLHTTDHDAIVTARDALRAIGGGELIVHSPDGRVRFAETVACTADPQRGNRLPR